MLLVSLLRGLLALWLLRVGLAATVVDGSVPLPASGALWNASIDEAHSAVSAPRTVGLTDTEIFIEWDCDISTSQYRFPRYFTVELAQGRYSEDFEAAAQVPVEHTHTHSLQSVRTTQRYTLQGLAPQSWYRLRVVPVFSSGPALPSLSLSVQTLRAAVNHWEPLLARRESRALFSRGLSDPVQRRPHLSPGVEVFSDKTSGEEDPRWHTDAPSREAPVQPSGRRGHSLTLVEDAVFMFGGRTNGYSCASTLRDTLDLGNADSGRGVYPCVRMNAEVNELWRIDANTLEWSFVNTSAPRVRSDDRPHVSRSAPAPREQHSAALLRGNLVVFGGKSRLHAVDALGAPILSDSNDIVFNDLWMLQVEHERTSSFLSRNGSVRYETDLRGENETYSRDFDASFFSSSPSTHSDDVDQDKRNVFSIDANAIVNQRRNARNESEGESPRYGQCVADITVKVRVRHPCVNQLRLSLMGPGPSTGSPNFFTVDNSLEVRLLSDVLTNTTDCVGGVHEFAFNDAFSHDPSTESGSVFRGNFTPAGRLSEFLGSSHASMWSLVVEDVKKDSLAGELVDWELVFSTSPCVPEYSWIPLWNSSFSSSAVSPVPRYRAKIVSHESSLFVFGGRDAHDNVLQDLYRFDVDSAQWTMLHPVGFSLALDPASSVGGSLAMVPWGLLHFGGYFRQRYLSSIADTSQTDRRDFLYRRAEDAVAQYYRGFTNEDGASIYTRDPQRGQIYENAIVCMDVVSQRWSAVNITRLDNTHLDNIFSFASAEDQAVHNDWSMYKNVLLDHLSQKEPTGRYLSAIVFVPSTALSWRRRFHERTLYDKNRASYQANIQGNVADSLIVFGGFDAATGSTADGSSGGFLSDLWILRFNQYSTARERAQHQERVRRHCQWRTNPSAERNFHSQSCMRGSGSSCHFRDLMMLIWCTQHVQTIV